MTNFDDDNDNVADDAADTLRFRRPDLDFDGPTDPDATAIWDLITPPAVRRLDQAEIRRRRHKIRETRQEIAGLRDAIAEGWDVGPELAHEERRLSALVSAERRYKEP